MRLISELDLGETGSEGSYDLRILTLEEAYAILEEDQSDSLDVTLTAMEAAAAEAIANHCGRRAANGSVPTLMAQSLVETFHVDRHWRSYSPLVLARRPLQGITSVAIDSDAVPDSDYTELRGAGMIKFAWFSAVASAVPGADLIVDYIGGFVSPPATVKLAAQAMLREMWRSISSVAQDATVRMVRYEGVGEVQYQQDTQTMTAARPLVPMYLSNLLAPYIDHVV